MILPFLYSNPQDSNIQDYNVPNSSIQGSNILNPSKFRKMSELGLFKEQMKKRTKKFAHDCVKFCLALPKDQLGKHIGGQLILYCANKTFTNQ